MDSTKSNESTENEVEIVGVAEIPTEACAESESTAGSGGGVESQLSSDAGLATVVLMLRGQAEALDKLEKLVISSVTSDRAKDGDIRALRDEFKRFGDEFIAQSQKEIFIDLIVLYDNVKQAINQLNTAYNLSAEEFMKAANNVNNLEEELLEILNRRDVVPFDGNAPVLDRRLHRAVKIIPTTIESENNKIARIVKIGFRWRDKVLRPEEVEIKRFESAPTTTGGIHG